MKQAPLYAKVQSILINRMENNIYPAGFVLPPEPELCKEFNASRTTIRKAIGLLTAEKYIEVLQGKGTTVLDRCKITQELNSVTSLLETFREQGCLVKSKKTSLNLVCAEGIVAKEMKLEHSEEVYCLQRVIEVDGKVVAFICNYLLPSFVPNIKLHIDKMTSLYLFLEQYYDLSIETATDSISARTVSDVESGYLECSVHTPIVMIRRSGTARGKKFYYSETIVNSPKYELKVFLLGRPS